MDSEQRILDALRENMDGLRFKELKKTTGLHQDTLTKRLQSLMEEAKVIKSIVKNRYVIGPLGLREAYALQILHQMLAEKDKGFDVYGGPGSESLDPLEDVMIRNTTLFASPGKGVSTLAHLIRVVPESLLFAAMEWMLEKNNVKFDEETHEKELAQTLSKLQSREESPVQVLAFSINLKDLVANITPDMARRILRRGWGRRREMATKSLE
jgi:hypothetical protein